MNEQYHYAVFPGFALIRGASDVGSRHFRLFQSLWEDASVSWTVSLLFFFNAFPDAVISGPRSPSRINTSRQAAMRGRTESAVFFSPTRRTFVVTQSADPWRSIQY